MTTSNHQIETQPLTQTEAALRAKQIKNVEYRLSFKLPESEPEYMGVMEATFDYTPVADAKLLFLDFTGGAVLSAQVCDGHVKCEHQGSKIWFESSLFRPGSNTIRLEFQHAYENSGIGFHRTRDHADGEYYVYSDFEPYNANRAFPCFDQPDLKATYTVEVEAPSKWEVISNSRETGVTSSGNWKKWSFPKTAKFSTYLFALIAGPLQKWESKTTGGIPMRLFSRKSMAPDLAKDVEHWFKLTDEGFKFFEKAFGFPYPFGKYDQILTPDYNHGAMENVGAVTFTESYIFRTEVTPIQVLRRAETIIHELAHMWFGNLVTMRWWDDLWLNESFATYISNLAMSKFRTQMNFPDVWQHFNETNKDWAYREDDLVTTHPIVGTAVDTREALANFDGITYGKGAAVLKQLVHYLGEEVFLKGVRSYFQKYAYQNATREDFLASLSEAAGMNLGDWETLWLKTSGTNSVQAVVSTRNGFVDKLVLKQFPDEADQKLRSHRTGVGLYDLNSEGALVLRDTLHVTYAGEETEVAAAVGKPAPQFVFPNVEDHDFVHVVLDSANFATLKTSLGKVSDPFLRQMLWSTVWNMVRHSKLPAQHFFELAMANLGAESNLAVLQTGVDYLAGATWYAAPEIKGVLQSKAERFIEGLFMNAQPGSPFQISLFFRYVKAARCPDSLSQIHDWLSMKEIPTGKGGLKMDQERRWAVVTRLAEKEYARARFLIEEEKERDLNDRGVIAALVAEAAIPEKENKRQLWDRLLTDQTLSVEKVRKIMGVFHDRDQVELTDFMQKAFFEEIAQLGARHSEQWNLSYARQMYPITDLQGNDARVTECLKKNPDLNIGVVRALRQNQQLQQRTVRARELSRKAASSGQEL